MERLILRDNGEHVRDFVFMRPPFLTSGEERGDEGLRVGWEWGVEEDKETVKQQPGPEVGWIVSRKDVGGWVFRHAIVEGGWEGKCVYTVY